MSDPSVLAELRKIPGVCAVQSHTELHVTTLIDPEANESEVRERVYEAEHRYLDKHPGAVVEFHCFVRRDADDLP